MRLFDICLNYNAYSLLYLTEPKYGDGDGRRERAEFPVHTNKMDRFMLYRLESDKGAFKAPRFTGFYTLSSTRPAWPDRLT